MEESSNEDLLTYLEFYSGVGGWSYALSDACKRIHNSILMAHEESDERKANSVSTAQSHHQQELENTNNPLLTKCVGAYDHSDLCHLVFQHNFPETNRNDQSATANHGTKRKNKKQKLGKNGSSKPIAIEKLSQAYLENMAAKIWMMSPPCQPHTRQHTNQEQDVDDPRSKSFLHLCKMISSMQIKALPQIILLENVIGFESSNSCRQWRHALFSRNYVVLHFHLNPPQIGIPNDRPRYYCIALLKRNNDETNDKNDIISSYVIDDMKQIDKDPPINKDLAKTDGNGLEGDSTTLMSIGEYLDSSNDHDGDNHDTPPLDENRITKQSHEGYSFVSEKILSSNASWCFDIVTTKDKRSACFTHSYGKYVRGTGSVLYVGDEKLPTNCINKDDNNEIKDKFKLISPEERSFDTNWNGMDLKNKLRYFTGREMARLMGFPVDGDKSGTNSPSFSFPSNCTQKQQWKLMGNSLNVQVASRLAEIALRSQGFKN